MNKSRLGQSLLRLEQTLAETRRNQQQASAAIVHWQQRWLSHRERISRRLELIETQLDQIEGEAAPETPRLSVVGAASIRP